MDVQEQSQPKKMSLTRSRIFKVFLVLFGFILLDFIWLRSLPKWEISYGSGNPTAVLFSLLRIIIFLIWLILQWASRQFSINISNLVIWVFLVPNLVLLGLGIYGFCIEPFHLTTSHIEVQVPGLETPKRIVQVSDLHVEFTTRREQKLPEYIYNLNPDMIVITGDLINESYVNNFKTWDHLRELIGKFNAPLGVYAVNGNVETPERLKEMLQGLQVRVLQNEVVRIPEFGEQFALVGINFRGWSHDKDQLRNTMAKTKPDDFTLLLYHKPDLIYEASDLSVDFYLAGHTHGGQVRLPFYGALFTNSRYGKTFEMGSYTVNKTRLFVSRGLGFTGGIAPRVRFLAPPEVVVVDLVPIK